MSSMDCNQLVAFQKKLQVFQKSGLEQICRECAEELADKLLQAVKKRTPKEGYPPGNVPPGNALREGWMVSEVKRQGDRYVVEISNPVEYASYVEYGYQDDKNARWVPGRFMLTISLKELQSASSAFLREKLEEKGKEVFAS